MVSSYYAGKLLIQLSLFAVFLLFFGLPSYHRYHQKGVLVKTEKASMQGLELPAVTICPRCFSKKKINKNIAKPNTLSPTHAMNDLA